MTNPAAVPAQPQASGKGKRRQITVLLGLVVLLGVLLGLAWFFNRDAALNAKVGDCLHQTAPDELKIVKCDDANAQFSVLGKVGGKEQIESTISITSVCDQWPDTTNTYWQGVQGKKGDVLCLKATKG
jgi:hypothetical protein